VDPQYEGNKSLQLFLSQFESEGKIGTKFNKNTCDAHMMHGPPDLARLTDGRGVLVSKW
jgi:hypothetical protein